MGNSSFIQQAVVAHLMGYTELKWVTLATSKFIIG